MVQSTGADGRATVLTVTAPVSTVNGVVVAMVADAAGNLRPLPVVTATPPATTGTAAPTTAPRSTTNRTADTTAGTTAGNVAGAGTGAQHPSTTGSSTPGVAVDGTSASTPATPTPTPSQSPAPATSAAEPGPGDVATVVTGLTTLTGWVPLTTR